MNMFGIKAVCLAALLLQTKAHEVVKAGALRKVSSSKGQDEGGCDTKHEDHHIVSNAGASQVQPQEPASLIGTVCAAFHGKCSHIYPDRFYPNHCCTENAICQAVDQTGTCECPQGFQYANEMCCPGLGSECNSSDQCCSGDLCSNNTNKCCNKWGDESCHEDNECCVSNAVCSDNKCCLHVVDRDKIDGAVCSRNEDCCGTAFCTTDYPSYPRNNCHSCIKTELNGQECQHDYQCCEGNCRLNILYGHKTC
ncbi:hypothetical protein ACHAWF_014089 [Thalassiosira exigua]